MVSVVELQRGAPVGRNAIEVGPGVCIETEVAEPAMRDASVASGFDVDPVVKHRVDRYAEHGLPEPRDQRRGRWLRRNGGSNVRKTPAWRRVPQVLDGRVVVDRDAEHDARATE